MLKGTAGCVLVLFVITIAIIGFVYYMEAVPSAVPMKSERLTNDRMDATSLRVPYTETSDEDVNKRSDAAVWSENTASAIASDSGHTDVTQSGYILPFQIYEEQTNGATNLWHLQMYAKFIGMTVVEPFAQDSRFEMVGLAPNFNNSLRFGDYFNIQTWNTMVINKGGNPLVGWEEFLSRSPLEAIVLYTLKRPDLKEPLTIAYDDDIPECKLGRVQIQKDDLQWLNSMFNIIRTVCYLSDKNQPHPLSIEEFTSKIFGNTSPNEVTLITVGWLGIRRTRIELPVNYDVPWNLYGVLPPSQKIITAYKSYVSRYIGDHKYVGIVFRTHHVLYHSPQTGNVVEQDKYLLRCSNKLGNVLDKVREKWKIFLAYDMGMYGSKKYSTKMEKRLSPLRDQIFLDVFNGSLQVEERDEMLKQAAGGITDRGFIAQLEKVIATNADCIILLGISSSFVRSSARQYMSLHATNRCVVSICSEAFRDVNKRTIISLSTLPDT